MSPAKKVAVIIVSSPILRGKSQDVYSNYLSSELCLLGFKVAKISILNECESSIAHELIQTLRSVDFVVLIGSLQPGVTNAIYKAVANVFKQDLISNQELNSALTDLQRNDSVSESLVPSTAKILKFKDGNSSVHPIIYVQRLFIVSNDEKSFRQLFQSLLKPFLTLLGAERKYTRCVCLNYQEEHLAFVQDVEEKFEVRVLVEKRFKSLLLKVQSPVLGSVLEAETIILKKAGSDVLYCEESDTSNCSLYQQINCFPHIKQAIAYIEECFSRYGPDNFFVSFNGGKDCTVLLHLVLVVLKRNYPDYQKSIICLYVQTQHPFEEVDLFIAQAEQYYNLKIVTFAKSIKEALASVLDTEKHMRACLMGTRRTDPHSSDLQIFQMTDKDWPQIMRVSPILDWHYSDIWDYLLMFNVPYCSLYDQGYTSLGGRTNTLRNPELLICDSDKRQNYLPAYKLLDGKQERCGRA